MNNASVPKPQPASGSIVDVELCVRAECATDYAKIQVRVRTWLMQFRSVPVEVPLTAHRDIKDKKLSDLVTKITIFPGPGCNRAGSKPGTCLTIDASSEIRFYPYQLFTDEPSEEGLGDNDDEDGGWGEEQKEAPSAGTHWMLPHVSLDDAWDSLVFDTDVKSRLIRYVQAMLEYSEHGINPDIITSNRLILLHGPPGTGKTTLAKALAQKLAIRQTATSSTSKTTSRGGGSPTYAQLVEINSHSLFSKWFSESGKLVQRLFSRLRNILTDNPNALLFVLVDEVESLSVARATSLSANEPSDAVRVVNALLTQLDSIRRFPNVLVIATSNLASSVDPAFLDRADQSILIDRPSPSAVYEIYRSCIRELHKGKIIHRQSRLLNIQELQNPVAPNDTSTDSIVAENSAFLFEVAKESVGLSGRALRKMPVLARAYHTDQFPVGEMLLADFLRALKAAVHDFVKDTKAALTDPNTSSSKKNENNEANTKNNNNTSSDSTSNAQSVNVAGLLESVLRNMLQRDPNIIATAINNCSLPVNNIGNNNNTAEQQQNLVNGMDAVCLGEGEGPPGAIDPNRIANGLGDGENQNIPPEACIANGVHMDQ